MIDPKKRVIEPKKKPDPYGVEQSEAKPTSQSEPPAAAAKTARFSAGVQNGVQIITFEQSSVLDAYEIEKLGDAIYHHLRPLEAPKVVVDLSHVDHLSSSALGMLIALRQVVVEKKGGGIAIANVKKDLHSIFKMTRLDKLARMCDSTEKAVQSLV
jgi:anti-sigma B factor antagonist